MSADHKDKRLSRRDFLTITWGAAGAVMIGEAAFVGLRFLAPATTEGEFGGQFNLGEVGDYPPGSVTPVEAGRFYLVHFKDGGLLAVYRRCTHLGCAVPYDPVEGQFVCPCHGSAFTQEGELLNPPAPRPLDLFELRVENGEIIVDSGNIKERGRTSPDDVVYP